MINDLIQKLINKKIVCRKCQAGKHFEYCLRTVEKDIREFKLKKHEVIANLAHFQTGKYTYVFRCTCPCIQDPLYQLGQYNQIFGKLI